MLIFDYNSDRSVIYERETLNGARRKSTKYVEQIFAVQQTIPYTNLACILSNLDATISKNMPDQYSLSFVCKIVARHSISLYQNTLIN